MPQKDPRILRIYKRPPRCQGQSLREAKMTPGQDPRSLRMKYKPQMYIQTSKKSAADGSAQLAQRKEAAASPEGADPRSLRIKC